MKNRGRRDYLVVGVTGGIGSGKSTACRMFKDLGRTVISADEIARTITETDPGVKKEILAAFGASIVQPSGAIDRKGLAEIVFTHAAKRKKLNSIVHPAVFREIDNRLEGLEPSRRFPYVLVEAALIFETGMDKTLDYTIVIDAPGNVRTMRVMKRDGSSASEVRGRMRSQLPAAEKAKRADFVLENRGPASGMMPGIRFIDTLLTLIAEARRT